MHMLHAMWSVLLDLAPWLLLGATIAGALHVLLPRGLIRRELRGRWGVLKAVALGVPLPLCSCGVIPTGLSLRRSGASPGATVGFLISTPQTGVDSILVSASFLGWPFAFFKVASAALTGLVGGAAVDALGGSDDQADGLAPGLEDSSPRRFRDGVVHALELLETIWRWIVVGVVASAAITVFAPDGWLAAVGSWGSGWAMMLTVLVALPMYVCATASVPIAAALVGAGLPPGAALVFLMAGPATNVATIGAVYRTLGGRTLALYLASIVGGSVGLGMVFDFLVPTGGAHLMHAHHESPWWAVGSAVVLLALCAWFLTRDVATLLRRWRAGRSHAQRLEIAVEGMTCGNCAARLERTLAGDGKVQSVVVELTPGRAIVTGAVSPDRLRELIEAAGFTPGVDPPTN